MKKGWLLGVLILVVGYVLGSLFPLSLNNVLQQDIRGKAEVQVTILQSKDKSPVTKLNVFMGKKPGPPPRGGQATTDNNGVATFYVKPDVYYVYFSTGDFPADLEYTTPQKPLQAVENQTTVYQVLLNSK
jgi:hypothetical protein